MVASGEEGSGIASTHADLRKEVPAALAPLDTENRLFLSHYTANVTGSLSSIRCRSSHDASYLARRIVTNKWLSKGIVMARKEGKGYVAGRGKPGDRRAA